MTAAKPAKDSKIEAHHLEEQIRRRAYEIYVLRDYQDGRDLDDWLQAEKEILQAQNATQPRWVVRLKGEPFDLELLSQQFRSANFAVTNEDGSFYARSPEFEALTSEPEVRLKASEMLESINGIGLLLDSQFQGVGFDAIAETDKAGSRKFYMEFFEQVRVRAAVAIEIVKADGTIEPSTQARFAESQLTIAQGDPKVAKALRIFGSREHSWHNLNNLLEIVQSDVGSKITKAGWATQGDLDRLTQTANSASAVGDSARHGHDKWEPPKKPMSPLEAEALITRILKNWITSK